MPGFNEEAAHTEFHRRLDIADGIVADHYTVGWENIEHRHSGKEDPRVRFPISAVGWSDHPHDMFAQTSQVDFPILLLSFAVGDNDLRDMERCGKEFVNTGKEPTGIS